MVDGVARNFSGVFERVVCLCVRVSGILDKNTQHFGSSFNVAFPIIPYLQKNAGEILA